MVTESQLRDKALRLQIRERIERGVLPVMVPQRIYGGYGSGDVCVACDQPIAPSQIDYEVDGPKPGMPLHFHFVCHVLWQLECARALGGGGQSQP